MVQMSFQSAAEYVCSFRCPDVNGELVPLLWIVDSRGCRMGLSRSQFEKQVRGVEERGSVGELW